MKNFVRNQCRKLSQSRTGAAVLMVLLVSVFVILMGSSVLFTSQNGYLVKIVDRMGLDSFYSTESLLDQVRAEVQDFSSVALKDSYTKVMSEYSFIVSSNADEESIRDAAQIKFSEYFLEELDSYYVNDTALNREDRVNDSGIGTEIFNFMSVSDFNTMVNGFNAADNGSTIALSDALYTTGVDVNGTTSVGGTYNPAALAELLGLDDDVTIEAYRSVDGTGNGYFTLEHGVAGDRMVIQDVTISFMEDGYMTYITTDIIIEMPDFVYSGDTNDGNVSSVYAGVPFSNTASIGKYWVKFSEPAVSEGIVVQGDMYGGVFFIYNESVGTVDPEKIIFSHSGGRLITSQVPIDMNNSDAQLSGYMDLYGSGTIKENLFGFEVYDGATFSTEEDSEIWTLGINAYDGSDLALAGYLDTHGDVYYVTVYDDYGNVIRTDVVPFGGINVAGDLRVYGGDGDNKSNISIAGDYFGFGAGGTSDSDSAILIDNTGVNLSLDYEFTKFLRNEDGSYKRDGLTGDRLTENVKVALNSLKIAGTGYLTVGSTDIVGNEYQLGQSISTLPDQLAYLIPIRALSSEDVVIESNPILLKTTEAITLPVVKVDPNIVLWADKKIGDYINITDDGTDTGTGTAHVISNATSGEHTLVYCFYDFKSLDHANAYFEDYIKYNGESFQENYNKFVTTVEQFKSVEDIMNDASIVTKGSFYAETDSNGIMVASGYGDSNAMNVSVETREQMYKNAAVTLNPDIPIDEDYTTLASKQNPFDYYVNLELLLEDTKYAGSFTNLWEPMLGFYDDLGLRSVLYNGGFIWTGKDEANEFLDDGTNRTLNTNLNMIVSTSGINLQARAKTQAQLDAYYPSTMTDLQIQIAEEDRLTYEGLVMSSVGVAIISPLISNPVGVIESLNAETEIFLFDSKNDTHGVSDWQKFIVYDPDLKVVETIEETDPSTGLLVERDIEHEGLAAYTYLYYSDLKSKYWNETDGELDAYLDTEVGKPNQYMPEAEYVTVKVAYRAYFDHLVYTTGSNGSEEHTPGEVEKDIVINWGANDLVYFENWEKY